MIKTLLFICLITQIKTIIPERPWEIEIVTKKTEEYLLLTRQEPITLTVEGPTYLRVYTRILLPENLREDQLYKLILEEGPLEERIISFKTDISSVTTDKKGTSVSKWRSFYIEVPDGEKTYKLTHWASPKDTILLRFSYESPKEWNELRANRYSSILEAIEEEKVIKYYLLEKEEQVIVKLNGPTKLKVIARLNFDETLFGKQSFSLIINDNGMESFLPFKCHKSDIIRYQNRNDIVPSNARTAYIPITNGVHTIKFSLSGTLAKSAALRFLTEP